MKADLKSKKTEEGSQKEQEEKAVPTKPKESPAAKKITQEEHDAGVNDLADYGELFTFYLCN